MIEDSRMGKKKKAVVLSSGGIDSTTAMAIARNEGYELYSLTFDYGQRHAVELEASKKTAEALGALQHLVIRIDLGKIGGSALTADIAVPHGRSEEEMTSGIPVTYVPARNTIFLSYALAWAEVLEAVDILIGVNAVDYSGYPDCRPEYIRAFEVMANLAIKAAVERRMKISIRTPLIDMTKAEIIRKGTKLGVDYRLTHSCYDPDAQGRACGDCDSCLLRKKGFREAGIPDPTVYGR
jgi:7-cyano-7-deazaguanine synthase